MNVTRVSVTARHIADGTPCSPGGRPVALAVTEALAGQVAGVIWVMVHNYDAWVTVHNYDAWVKAGEGEERRRYRAPLDDRARAFIEAFDREADGHEALAPFETELTWREVPR